MPKRKDESKVNEGTPVEITYLGKEGWARDYAHVYLVNGEKKIHFTRKLQSFHRVGFTYPATRYNEDGEGRATYGASKRGHSIPSSYKLDKKMIAEAIHTDARISEQVKADTESRKLEQVARNVVEPLKEMYGRASDTNKVMIIRAIVEELEKT